MVSESMLELDSGIETRILCSHPFFLRMTTVVLKVGMSCQGCVGAVNRVLGKMEGVESFDIDIKEQKVTVKGNVEPEAVLKTVSKTGKKTSFWEA
nr:copper transport protein ATX1-like [Ipomoea batatas]